MLTHCNLIEKRDILVQIKSYVLHAHYCYLTTPVITGEKVGGPILSELISSPSYESMTLCIVWGGGGILVAVVRFFCQPEFNVYSFI